MKSCTCIPQRKRCRKRFRRRIICIARLNDRQSCTIRLPAIFLFFSQLKYKLCLNFKVITCGGFFIPGICLLSSCLACVVLALVQGHQRLRLILLSFDYHLISSSLWFQSNFWTLPGIIQSGAGFNTTPNLFDCFIKWKCKAVRSDARALIGYARISLRLFHRLFIESWQ